MRRLDVMIGVFAWSHSELCFSSVDCMRPSHICSRTLNPPRTHTSGARLLCEVGNHSAEHCGFCRTNMILPKDIEDKAVRQPFENNRFLCRNDFESLTLTGPLSCSFITIFPFLHETMTSIWENDAGRPDTVTSCLPSPPAPRQDECTPSYYRCLNGLLSLGEVPGHWPSLITF